MTSAEIVPAPGILGRIRARVKPEWREPSYRVAGAVIMMLFALGVLKREEAALWTQLVVALITCLFALLFATSTWRAALYLIVGPLGAVLMWYGIVNSETWAVIAAAVAQAFGITTAAAKTVQLPSSGT
ncbi:phage holin [Mycolicibacterium fortuitum]|uniref:phage holin n=1 Tax=Mycolicibacterium fortuitum TaxID=1766 RepID=UPI003FD73CDA